MSKLKTHKGLKKRVRITPRGKVMRRKSFKGHLMSHKSGDRRRRLRKPAPIVGKTAKNVIRALGGR